MFNPISNEAVHIYQENKAVLLDTVNIIMMERDDLFELIGHNTVSMMENNHNNHHDFISSVINQQQYQILESTLPWVYKVYHTKGFKFDYFKYELNAWIDAIDKHVLSQEKNELKGLYHEMLNLHEKNIELSSSLPKVQYNWNDELQLWLDTTLRNDSHTLLEMTKSKLDQGITMETLYLDYFQPLMYRVGDMWEKNDITVAHEHLSTSMISRVMTYTYANQTFDRPSKGKVLISSHVNEFHELGARMIADLFELDGWQVKYYGADLPTENLVQAIDEFSPMIIVISMTMMKNIELLIESISEIKNKHQMDYLKIVVGGLAFNNNPELKKVVPADAFPYDATETLQIANKWLNER